MKTEDLKIATIDIGSNSFLLLLCKANPTGITRIEKDVVEIVRLGQGLAASKRFHPDALTRAEKTLKTFKELIDQFQPDEILPMATAAARIAENRDELLTIGKRLGLSINTIPGEKEAQVTYQGVFWGQNANDSDYNVLIDIGGGSTELIVGRGSKIEFSTSIPFGAVLLTEKWIKTYPVIDSEDAALKKEIDTGVANALQAISKFRIKNVIAVAGTPTTLAQIILGGYDDAKINGYQLSIEKLKSLELDMRKKTPEERIKEMGIPSGRADILYAGSVILRKLAEAMNVSTVQVSTRGVRHGIVADYFLSQEKTIK